MTVCLLRKSLKPVPFSPKLETLDDSDPQVESHNAFAFGRGTGVQREGAELQARGKRGGCNPSWARAGSSCSPLALPSPSFPLMQSKKLHNGGKNKWVLVEAVT